MIEHLNERIDTMLSQISEAEHFFVSFGIFQDFDNSRMDFYVAKETAYFMRNKQLIRIEGEICKLDEFGIFVIEQGGWLNYLNEIENKIAKENEAAGKRMNAQIRKEVQEEFIRRQTIEKFRYDKLALWISIAAALFTLLGLILK